MRQVISVMGSLHLDSKALRSGCECRRNQSGQANKQTNKKQTNKRSLEHAVGPDWPFERAATEVGPHLAGKGTGGRVRGRSLLVCLFCSLLVMLNECFDSLKETMQAPPTPNRVACGVLEYQRLKARPPAPPPRLICTD